MSFKYIAFTDIEKAEVKEDSDIRSLGDGEILVETEFTAVSAGTERALLMKLPNTGDRADGTVFPVRSGYSGVGFVAKTGKNVTGLKVGDRVFTHWGTTHAQYNIILEANAIKLSNPLLPSQHAAFAAIAGFSASAVRKTRLEFGESAIVFGVGILGAFAVQILRAAGAIPIIAADPSKDRRELALKLGADYAFDPSQADFYERVKDVTGGDGANAVIEVTGQSAALQQSLEVVAPLGRIALLGCTRVSDTPIDFYQKVHRPGVEIIGAHTNARPRLESRPHNWTWQDDCRAIIAMMEAGRLDMTKIVSEIHSPLDAPAVYARLAENKNFPLGVAFDWKKVKA